ncbi:MAG: hypothetical protein IJS61_08990 [Firmicutes bacterium]|nr:hypothetical protein [Bacillota bacterium]
MDNNITGNTLEKLDEYNQQQDKLIFKNLQLINEQSNLIEKHEQLINELSQKLKNQLMLIADLSEQNKSLEQKVNEPGAVGEAAQPADTSVLETRITEQGKRIIKNAEKTQNLEKLLEEITEKNKNLESLINSISEREKNLEKHSAAGDASATAKAVEQQQKDIASLKEQIAALPTTSGTGDMSAYDQKIAKLQADVTALAQKPAGAAANPALENKIIEQNNHIAELVRRTNAIQDSVNQIIAKCNQYDSLINTGAMGAGGGAVVGDAALVDLKNKEKKQAEQIAEITEKQNMHYQLLNDFKSESDAYSKRIDDCMQQIAGIRSQVSVNRVVRPSEKVKSGGLNITLLIALAALIIGGMALYNSNVKDKAVKPVSETTTITTETTTVAPEG